MVTVELNKGNAMLSNLDVLVFNILVPFKLYYCLDQKL